MKNKKKSDRIIDFIALVSVIVFLTGILILIWIGFIGLKISLSGLVIFWQIVRHTSGSAQKIRNREEEEGVAKKGNVGITRQQYKDIKKKDHKQMEAFLIKFWQDGYNDGLAAAKKANVSPADIENAISGIKGMGETKVNAVMQRIYKLYEEAAE